MIYIKHYQFSEKMRPHGIYLALKYSTTQHLFCGRSHDWWKGSPKERNPFAKILLNSLCIFHLSKPVPHPQNLDSIFCPKALSLKYHSIPCYCHCISGESKAQIRVGIKQKSLSHMFAASHPYKPIYFYSDYGQSV